MGYLVVVCVLRDKTSWRENSGGIYMNGSESSEQEITPEDRRAIYKWILQATLGVAAYGVIIFLAAGTLDWVWAWLWLGILAAFLAAHPLILVPINPGLLVERGKGIRDEGVKAWDKWIASFAGGVMPFISWILAGLDVRFGWTGLLPIAYHLIGLVGSILGYGLFLWAMASNAYFSEGVRIQEERGHSVATGGPYRYVRHPGYSGAILAVLSTPLLLGSLWAMIPSIVSAALYVVRTYLEDKTLLVELPGYDQYTQQTRYRLLPRIW
jgi:protein-S-isoprenylcysteine O-methyltransferase Ste14